jgi:hypothetical protein
MALCVRCLIAWLLLSSAGHGLGSARAQWTERVTVKHAAFAVPGAPSALVHAGPSFDAARPLHLVVYLHGFNGCAEVLMNGGDVACKPGAAPLTGWNLAAAHDAARTNTLFVIPQLAFMKRNGRPGCFGRSGCFRDFIAEVLAALPESRLGGRKSLADVATLTLVAHSAGYRAASAILEYGAVQQLLHDVVLFDALYGKQEIFLGWISTARKQARRLVSLHTGAGTPAVQTFALLRHANRALGANNTAKLDADFDDAALRAALGGKRVVIARANVPHREVPGAYLARVLEALEAGPQAAHTANVEPPRGIR